ncbi:MAG: hypothetical protein ACJAU0_000458 [Flavobacteriales bacterium]|jgi:hypothetical protein
MEQITTTTCPEIHSAWEGTDTTFYWYVEQALAAITERPYRHCA